MMMFNQGFKCAVGGFCAVWPSKSICDMCFSHGSEAELTVPLRRSLLVPAHRPLPQRPVRFPPSPQPPPRWWRHAESGVLQRPLGRRWLRGRMGAREPPPRRSRQRLRHRSTPCQLSECCRHSACTTPMWRVRDRRAGRLRAQHPPLWGRSRWNEGSTGEE